MKKFIISLLASASCFGGYCHNCEGHQLILMDEAYYGDGLFGLFIDKTAYSYFSLPMDENNTNPYDLMKEYEVLPFEDAKEVFPRLEGLDHCYGLSC